MFNRAWLFPLNFHVHMPNQNVAWHQQSHLRSVIFWDVIVFRLVILNMHTCITHFILAFIDKWRRSYCTLNPIDRVIKYSLHSLICIDSHVFIHIVIITVFSHIWGILFTNYLYLSHLTGNHLSCDCSIFSFWSWLIPRPSLGTSAQCSNGTLVTALQQAAIETCSRK